jgi:regulatory protein
MQQMQCPQLSFAFPNVASPRNNHVMSPPPDQDEREKKEAAQKLRNKALRLLTTREHSREELLRKLAQAKARRTRQDAQTPAPEKDEIERVVDDLAAQGWQSDDRYAEAIVRRLTGQAARRYIEDKMAQAGIKKDVAKLAMESLEQDETEVATALWTRRFGDAPADDKERQRQIRFLLSRGFHLGDAFKIVPKAPPPPKPVREEGESSFTRSPRSSFGRSRPWGGKNDRDPSEG